MKKPSAPAPRPPTACGSIAPADHQGVVLKDLDAPDVFEKHVTDLIASLAELRKAPLVEEEYHGPVLLSSDASADTLRA